MRRLLSVLFIAHVQVAVIHGSQQYKNIRSLLADNNGGDNKLGYFVGKAECLQLQQRYQQSLNSPICPCNGKGYTLHEVNLIPGEPLDISSVGAIMEATDIPDISCAKVSLLRRDGKQFAVIEQTDDQIVPVSQVFGKSWEEFQLSHVKDERWKFKPFRYKMDMTASPFAKLISTAIEAGYEDSINRDSPELCFPTHQEFLEVEIFKHIFAVE